MPPADDQLNEPVLPLLRTGFPRIRVDQTIESALAAVRHSRIDGQVVYFYVLDAEERLVGVMPVRALLLSPPDTRVADVMIRKLVTLPQSATVFDACELFMLHRFLALPVVDGGGRMLGVIDVGVYTDEMADLADREQSDDVFQLIGVRLAQVRHASVPALIQRRLPWLAANIFGGLLCALLAWFFQDVLQKVIALALFMPVMLALAESVSIQSLTLTLQAQHGGKVDWRAARASLLREVPVGLALGAACGAIVAAVAWGVEHAPPVAAVMMLSILAAVTVSSLLGRLAPLVLLSVQRDPKVASGPLVLALSDIITLLVYFGLGAWWLV